EVPVLGAQAKQVAQAPLDTAARVTLRVRIVDVEGTLHRPLERVRGMALHDPAADGKVRDDTAGAERPTELEAGAQEQVVRGVQAADGAAAGARDFDLERERTQAAAGQRAGHRERVRA